MGIAAHEVAHAYQDADGSRAYRIRKAVAEPLAQFAPFSAFFFIGGFWFDIPFLMALSLGLRLRARRLRAGDVPGRAGRLEERAAS